MKEVDRRRFVKGLVGLSGLALATWHLKNRQEKPEYLQVTVEQVQLSQDAYIGWDISVIGFVSNDRYTTSAKENNPTGRRDVATHTLRAFEPEVEVIRMDIQPQRKAQGTDRNTRGGLKGTYVNSIMFGFANTDIDYRTQYRFSGQLLKDADNSAYLSIHNMVPISQE